MFAPKSWTRTNMDKLSVKTKTESSPLGFCFVILNWFFTVSSYSSPHFHFILSHHIHMYVPVRIYNAYMCIVKSSTYSTQVSIYFRTLRSILRAEHQKQPVVWTLWFVECNALRNVCKWVFLTNLYNLQMFTNSRESGLRYKCEWIIVLGWV